MSPLRAPLFFLPFLWSAGFCSLSSPADGQSPGPELILAQVLIQAEAVSPDLKAAQSRAEAVEQSIKIAKAAFLPTADFEAIDSFGFPGSSRDLGISGLMGSPYRSGPGVGVVANLALVDFGRRYALLSAEQSVVAAQSQVQAVRFQVDQAALQIYLDASRYRGQQEAAVDVVREVAGVQREVNRFVRTGQRSVVERLLVQDQTTRAQMEADTFQKQYELALGRLAIAIGASGPIACPSPLHLIEPADSSTTLSAFNPAIAQAAAEALAAQAQAKAVEGLQMPRLMATASAGDDDEARLVAKHYYSGGFGFELPLFYGFRLSGLARQAKATAAARNEDVLALRLQVNELNARYDETIGGDRVKLSYLVQELEVAHKALKLAKERYLAFSGALVDVREAVRNLERIESDLIDVRADLILALGSKALLNGKSLS